MSLLKCHTDGHLFKLCPQQMEGVVGVLLLNDCALKCILFQSLSPPPLHPSTSQIKAVLQMGLFDNVMGNVVVGVEKVCNKYRKSYKISLKVARG